MTFHSRSALELRVVLAEYEPLTPLDAADLMGWTYERAYRCLRVLEDAGQVELVASKRYRLTEKGRRELDGVTSEEELR